jgi:hypothetical protein
MAAGWRMEAKEVGMKRWSRVGNQSAKKIRIYIPSYLRIRAERDG